MKPTVKERILQLVSMPGHPGAEKQLGLLVRELPSAEFDVSVSAVSIGGPQRSISPSMGVPVTRFEGRWPLDPRIHFRLGRHVARWRPDLIHSWDPTANAYAHAVARASGVKHHVASCRSVDPSRSSLGRAVDRYVAGRSDRIVVNGCDLRDSCIRRGFPAEGIVLIPNAVEPSRESGTTRGQFLAELGLPWDSRLIGVVDSLHRRKRIKDAIWAADLLKVIRQDVHLLIIGDGPHRDRLLTFRDQVVIRDAVHFLGRRTDVRQIMSHFDVFWSTSGHESLSNGIMEAMAAAVPVVATDIPGTRELVVPDMTGHLVPTGDRAAIARHTNRLLDDPELATRLGQAGQERMAERFGVPAMVRQYAELYRQMLL